MSLLKQIDFNIFIRPEEFENGNTMFPPNRFYNRDKRLRALHDLWEGDLSDYLTELTVPVNIFQYLTTRQADLMLMSEPTGVDNALLGDGLYDAIIDLSRYGGVLLHWDGDLSVRDPRGWYPLHDGDIFMTTFVSDSAASDRPDRARIEVVMDTGESYEIYYEYSDRQLGRILERKELPAAEVRIVPADPAYGIWGQSEYQKLCGPAVEIVRRITENSYVLDLFSGPTIGWASSQSDAVEDLDINTTNLTDQEIRQKINEGIGNTFRGKILPLPADISEVDFLQPNVSGVGQSLAQVQAMRQFIADITGIPEMTGANQNRTGQAWRRAYLPWYARTKRLQNKLKTTVEQMIGTTFEWLHVFDSMELEDEGEMSGT